MIRYTIAVVDDEEAIRDSLEMILSEDYTISCFPDAESFLLSMDASPPDLVLMDIGLPAMSGMDALNIVKQKIADLPVIMITAFEDIHMVIRSMKSGAFDFILKPINPDILEYTLKKAVASIALRKEVRLLQEKYLKDHEPVFIGESKHIEDIMDFIHTVAKSPDTPIMIMGETGTGKELIAKAIHARSPLFQGPFVAVNCSAFPDDLIESELFGYDEGAFSGAKKQGKKGLIEEADNGTLFLDEVADLSLAGQAKLLRFLENGEFYKIGSTRKHKVSVRIVSATNKNLEELMDQDLFRKDLYFRLCVVKAKIPSLNERKEDILSLAKHFLFQFNQKFKKKLTGLSPEAENILLSHPFTGNVRELKNIIERAALIAKTGTLTGEDLGIQEPLSTGTPTLDGIENLPVSIPEQGLNLSGVLGSIEKKYMEQALVLTRGNESKAARLLKMNHHTFRYKFKKAN
jgi:DNA-binding NtrC family response regulator